MEDITKYSDFKINEALVEVEETEDGVYVLTLQDIKDIVDTFNESGHIDDETILKELQNYKFVKVEDTEITEIGGDLDTEVEEIDELSSDDENPTFIKKFEES